MNKKLFVLLVVLMSLSLLGIIFVQVYWIQTSINDKEEQFSRTITDILDKVASRVEKREMKEYSDRLASLADSVGEPKSAQYKNFMFVERDLNSDEILFYSHGILEEDYNITSAFFDNTLGGKDTTTLKNITSRRTKSVFKEEFGLDGKSYNLTPIEKVTNIISDLLVSNGFNEMLSNSLTKSDYYKETADSLVRMKNPLSRELDVLRQSMVFDGLETIVYNQNRRVADIKLFEWGKTYFKTETKFKEHSHLSLFISGASVNENWDTTNAGDVNFYQLKGVVNTIMEKFGMNKFNVRTEESDLNCLEYGLKHKVNNIDLVEFGKIDATTQKQFDINNEVFYVIFNYDNFMKLVAMNKVVYKEVSKFPTMRRDLALLIDKAVTYSSIKELASKQERKLLKAINLFDVYEGKNLPEDKKSYAVSFQFQDENKTLIDKQIDKVMTKIITALEKELGAQLR